MLKFLEKKILAAKVSKKVSDWASKSPSHYDGGVSVRRTYTDSATFYDLTWSVHLSADSSKRDSIYYRVSRDKVIETIQKVEGEELPQIIGELQK